MSRSLIPYLLIFFVLAPLTSKAQYVIKGNLFGSGGYPMPKADIVWVGNPEKFPRDVIEKFTVGKDGGFQFDTHRRGLHRIWFCDVNHKSYMIPFYLEKPDTTIINIFLSRLEIPENLGQIILYADYDPVKDKNGIKDTIKIGEDGVFRKTLKAYGDKFIYDLRDISREYEISGSMLDSYNFDCSTTFEEKWNYYYSNVINTPDKKILNFEYDPKLLKSDFTRPFYSFIKADTLTKEFLLVHEDHQNRMNKYNEYIAEGKRKGVYNNEYANAYKHDKDMDELDKLIETESNVFMKSAWTVSRMGFAVIDAFFKTGVMKVSKEQAIELLNDVPPDSPLWSYYPNGILAAIGQAKLKDKAVKELSKGGLTFTAESDPYKYYLIEAYKTNPDLSIKSRLLVWLIQYFDSYGQTDKVLEYMDEFRRLYPEEYKKRVLRDRVDPDRNIQPKKQVPDFRFFSIKDSTKIKTNKSLLGKKYLLHFWATWCAPCRTEMPAIQNFQSKFGGRNFEVISIAVDASKNNVFDFQSKIKMPWFNSFQDVRNNGKGPLRDFEVSSIPKLILVDEKGYIIAVDELEKIMEILNKK